MPEICEVALTAEILHRKLKNKVLTSIKFFGDTYKYGPNGTKPEGYNLFVKSLPLKIKKVDSRGKFLWFELTDDNITWYIWNTFNLKGGWSLEDDTHKRAQFNFENDVVAYYYDTLGWGTFKFSKSQEDLRKQLELLSPDFLKDDNFDLSNITKYKSKIVGVLMDQKKIGSGIGNYLVAEILYHAKISPHRKCNTLTNDEIKQLTYSIKYIIKICYMYGGSKYMHKLEKELNKLPRIDYHPNIKIKKSDQKFMFMVYNEKTDPLGNPVKEEKIVGKRTTYWVPNVQH